VCKFCVNQKAQKFAQCKLSKLVFIEQTLVKHGANPDISQNIIGANLLHTGFVQVPLHLHRRLHLHVVLEEAAAERGLVVGLLRLGLDGRLHPGLRHCGGDDADAPHGLVVVRPVRHRVRLLAREKPQFTQLEEMMQKLQKSLLTV